MALQEGFIKTLVDATRDWVKDYVEEHGGGGDADEVTYDASLSSHESGSVGEAIAKVVPNTDGTESQVLTLDENSKPIWKTPAIGGLEVVNITLSTEDGQCVVSGLEIAVSVEGEDTTRYLTTNTSGKVSFKVDHGLQYTIAFPTIEGYLELADVTYRSSINVRSVTGAYSKDVTITQEHVKVTLSYVGGDGTRAASVQVQIGTTTNSYAVVNNVAEFDIPLGTTYEIKYVDTNSYATPNNHTYLAELHNRLINVTYIGSVEGLTWVKYDGTAIPFDSVTADMKSSIAGLRISTNTLIEGKATFVVPLEYLLAEKSIGTKQWCTSNIQFQQLPIISSSATAVLPANADGEGNTLAAVEEARDGSTTVPAGTSVPAFAAVQAVKYTINGVEKTCFLGSYAQIRTFSDNRTNINAICLDRFGKVCIAVNSGYWWTSTQCSATNAVYLSYGGWNVSNKASVTSVVPLLAY